MPRIRKKTSKRGTTARRARVKSKVAETRKKSKKAAKKDHTWKSKKPKDPGIPNNFPYKDQILAEIAAEKRQAAEAKARRKEEKKNLRTQQKSALEANGRRGDDDDGGSGGEDNDDAEGEESHFDGVATLGGPTGTRKSSSKSTEGTPATMAGGASVFASASIAGADGAPPPLLNPDLPHLAAVLDKADVVIEVLDARDPLAHRSSALEVRVAAKEGQKLLLVLNKIDTCPREPTAAWAAHLRSEHPTLLFRVASSFLPPVITHGQPPKGKGKSKEPSNDAWGLDAVSQLLGSWAQEKTGDEPLHVAVVGLANSGKSAFINSLARSAALDIYAPSSTTKSPTTTPHALEVTLELNGKPVVFIDTPGLAWQPSEEEDRERRRSQDVLLRNKGRIDRLKDPTPAVSYIVSRTETEDLMVVYGLPAFAKGDVDAFLVGIARAHGLIKKGGNPDLTAAARIVLRDWSTGKFSRYAVLPARSSPGTTTNVVSPTPTMIYAGDAALLERLTPRKEFRRTGNLVRLSSERIDDRALVLETPWVGADASDGESDSEGEGEDENEGEVEMEAIGSGTDEEEATDGADSVESAESGGLEASVSEEENDDGGENADADEDGEDGDEAPPNTHSSSVRKRKRRPPSTTPKQQADPARPSKKVAFAAEVVPSNKRTPNPTLLPRRPIIATHSKKQKPDLPRPSATTPSSKKVHSGVHSAGGAPMRARKPAANAPMTTAAQKRKQAASRAGDDDAYDFSTFF